MIYAGDDGFANDAWLRHILWQTSHHCGMKWSNIILSKAKTSYRVAIHHLLSKQFYAIILAIGGVVMKENKLVELSMDFSVDIVNLIKFLNSNHETIISNQIGRSGT